MNATRSSGGQAEDGPQFGAPQPAPDDRSPFSSGQAVIHAITRHSDHLSTEAVVLEAFIEGQGPKARGYLEAIRRTGHYIFYHQLQELFEFGKRNVRPEMQEGFCRAIGKAFMEFVFADSIHQLLQMAFARSGEFQSTVGKLMQMQLYNYASEKYSFAPKAVRQEIQVAFGYANPEQMRRYLESHGLDVDQCFRNSFEFIGGALEEFTSLIIDTYDASSFRLESDGLRGCYYLPIGKKGGFAYENLITKLVGHISDLKERQKSGRANAQLQSDLIIDSPLMRETWERIRRAGRSSEIVLFRGESGTGKSFIARKIHDASPRRGQPLVEVGLTADLGTDNLIQSDLFGHERGAFTGAEEQKQGLFSLADGGTIFLDEIGDASPELQAKLLRVLENSTFKRLGGIRDISVDVRVILATNRNLEAMVDDGTFRADLYYRINVISIMLPALRERKPEIPALAEFLLARSQTNRDTPPCVLAPDLADQLSQYDWPGNIRELDHALRYAAAMVEGGTITSEDLPDTVRTCLAGVRPGKQVESPEISKDGSRPIIDVENLRYHLRNTRPLSGAGGASYDLPAHIECAKRTWLKVLIDECGGELALVARFWDRSSERTLRSLIKTYSLTEHLQQARQRARS